MARNWPTGPEPSARWRTSWTFWRRLAWYPVKLLATSASWVMTSTVSNANSRAPNMATATASGNGSRRRSQVTTGLRMNASRTATAVGIKTALPK